jgi:hypothetical protein
MLAPFDRDCKPSRRTLPLNGKCKSCQYSAQRKSDEVRQGPGMPMPAIRDAVVARRSDIRVATEVDLEPIWIGFSAQPRYFMTVVASAEAE